MKLADLNAVNSEVNSLPYLSDAERYGNIEFWTQIDDGGGDCEDFAIAKLRRLVAMGWPIERLRLACCFTETGEYHAVLIASADEGDYMLDNRKPRPVPANEIVEFLRYQPTKIQSAGGSRDWVEWTGAKTVAEG